MFLNIEVSMLIDHHDESGDRTGYSVPFTRRTRIKPRKIMGRVFLITEISLGGSGALRYAGSLSRGIEETTPWENTNDPTPRSILLRYHMKVKVYS
jgi:hypothetical protein